MSDSFNAVHLAKAYEEKVAEITKEKEIIDHFQPVLDRFDHLCGNPEICYKSLKPWARFKGSGADLWLSVTAKSMEDLEKIINFCGHEIVHQFIVHGTFLSFKADCLVTDEDREKNPRCHRIGPVTCVRSRFSYNYEDAVQFYGVFEGKVYRVTVVLPAKTFEYSTEGQYTSESFNRHVENKSKSDGCGGIIYYTVVKQTEVMTNSHHEDAYLDAQCQFGFEAAV